MSDLVKLKFVNYDARSKNVILSVSRESIAPIMAWYGAFYAGDEYKVLADGVKLKKDHNGELVE